jgi:glucokinase
VELTDHVACRPVLLVVTGVPGAGKTTLGSALAAALEVPFVSLDSIKEELYLSDVDGDPFELRLAAEAEMERRLNAIEGRAVVDIWIAPNRDTNRVARLLRGQHRDVVELLCRVAAEVAIERYTRRRRTGPHRPADASTLRRIHEAAKDFQPMRIGRCIEVDTSRPVNVGRLINQLCR